ncbi:MAG: hypothetical protein AB7G93_09400 [Bdellovibrionales bacterium]
MVREETRKKYEKALALIESGKPMVEACKKVGMSDASFRKIRNEDTGRRQPVESMTFEVPSSASTGRMTLVCIQGTPEQIANTLRQVWQ